MRTHLYSIKRTNFAVPLVSRLYKIHSIMRMLASLSHKIVWHRWLIHQLDIIGSFHVKSTQKYLTLTDLDETWFLHSVC